MVVLFFKQNEKDVNIILIVNVLLNTFKDARDLIDTSKINSDCPILFVLESGNNQIAYLNFHDTFSKTALSFLGATFLALTVIGISG